MIILRTGFLILCHCLTAMAFSQTSNSVISTKAAFIENKGQIIDQNQESNSRVLFLMSGHGLNVQLRKTGFSYDIYEGKDSVLLYHRIDIDFVDFNQNFIINKEGKSENYNNYYTTNANGVGEVYSYGKITYSNIYNGIDVVFYNDEIGFKYDFVIRSGANFNEIKLKYTGSDKLTITDSNQLTIQSRFGDFTEEIPTSYYIDNQIAKANFKLTGNVLGYQIEDYDPTRTLIIDPVPNRVWGSYYGGGSSDLGRAIITSKKTNYIYLCGWTYSYDYMATSGAFQTALSNAEDGFLAKMDTSGNRIWGTYIGGWQGDRLYSLTEDSDNNVYAVGESYSTSISTTTNAFQTTFSGAWDDAIIFKFDSSGKRIWSTYYGGNGHDEAYYVTFDKYKHIYVMGKTSSSNVITTTNGFQNYYSASEDGFIAKFDTSGKRIWSTYYGGNSQDYIVSCAFNSKSDLFLFGNSYSSNNISSTGSYQSNNAGDLDCFLVNFDSAGNRKWGTYYGGAATDYSIGVRCDSADYIYFYGYTESTSGIATSGAYQTSLSGSRDAFIAKFNSAGQRIWGTYYGGNGIEQIYEADLFIKGAIVIGGFTTSSNAIASSDAWQKNLSASEDGFIAKFNTSDGKRVWGSYYGSTGSDKILGITLKGRAMYVTGITTSTTNLTTSGVYQSTYAGGRDDAFVAKFEDDSCSLLAFRTIKKDILCKGEKNGEIAVIPVDGYYPYKYKIDSDTFKTDSIFTQLIPGSHKIVLRDNRGCLDSANHTIVEPTKALKSVFLDTIVYYCSNKSANVIAKVSGGTIPYSFFWNSSPIQTKDTAFGLNQGNYMVLVTDKNNCKDSSKVEVIEALPIVLKVASKKDVSCFNTNNGTAKISIANAKIPYYMKWNIIPSVIDTVFNLKPGDYQFNIRDNIGCSDSIKFTITQPDSLEASFNLPNIYLCNKTTTSVKAIGKGGTQPYSFSWKTSPIRYTDTLNDIGAGAYEVVISDINGCKDSGIYAIYETSPIITSIDTIINVSCYGLADGFAKIIVKGAQIPVEYKWDTAPNQLADSAINLAKGTYTCIVTDIVNCADTIKVTISEPDQLGIAFDSIIATMCIGQTIGKAKSLVSGGTPPYGYEWNTTPISNIYKIDSLLPGIYQVKVTDFNGCNDSLAFITKEFPSIDLSIVSKLDVMCFDSNSGELIVKTSGASPPYTYNWNTVPISTSDTVIGLKAGSYLCIANDANGCYDTISADIFQPIDSISIDAITMNESCVSFNDGSIEVLPKGGTPPFIFNWNTSPPQVNEKAIGLKKGAYQVTIKDKNGCELKANYSIIAEDSLPQFYFPKDTEMCDGILVTVDYRNYVNTFFKWNDGDTAKLKQFSISGFYTLQSIHNCGDQNMNFTLNVKNCYCNAFIPNAFTPNDDLLNETFKPNVSCDVSEYVFRIYNRWGEKLFESQDLVFGWDGKYKGLFVPNEAYLYTVDFIGAEGIEDKRFSFRGTVTVLK